MNLPVAGVSSRHLSSNDPAPGQSSLSFQTPVGPIGLNVGYKLNPSEFDERDAGEVLNALIAGLPVTSVPTDWRQRIHLSFGAGL